MTQMALILLLFVQQALAPEAGPTDVMAYNAYEHLHAARFDQAEKEFEKLSRVEGENSECYMTIVKILRNHKDGVYLLTESYPPGAELLGSIRLILKPGFIMLSKPMAMEAALRDFAKDEVRKAAVLLNKAAEITESSPGDARQILLKAGTLMDHADHLSPGITDSYRLELAQSIISTHRSEASFHARQFDLLCGDLGDLRKKDSPEYVRRLELMVTHLGKAIRQLEKIALLADNRKKDLSEQLTRARNDIAIIKSIATMIKQEKQRIR